MAGGGFVVWVLSAFAVLAASAFLAIAQDQTGFISIDCGKAANTTYTDPVTGIVYVPDGDYIDSGETKSISTQYKVNGLQKQFADVTSFPNGNRNCYTLYPKQVESTKYLIRAQFLYGNYDAKNKLPKFDLYVGANYWTTVSIEKADTIASAELLHSPLTNVTHVCLVNTGFGTPFISVLELRLVNSTIYVPKSGSLSLDFRLNLGSSKAYRYGDDEYDRIWEPIDWTSSMQYLSNTDETVSPNYYLQPSSVMSTAITPKDPTSPIMYSYTPTDTTVQHYNYMHFSEVEILKAGDARIFDINLNGAPYIANLTPSWASATTVFTSNPLTAKSIYNFSLEMTSLSTLPPILNAVEVYTVCNISQLETDPTDSEAVRNIKSVYSLNKIWQGDPCAPRYYSWDGLDCSFTDSDVPRIIALNLSSSNLVGTISDYISHLVLLEQLDLSNNNLTGTVPDFLSKMTSLNHLNLKGNNLTGVVPAELVKKSTQGSLTLEVDGNSGLCLSYPCQGVSSKKKTSIVIPIIGAIVGVVFLIIIILVIVLCVCKKKKMQPGSEAGKTTPVEIVITETQKSQASVTDVARESILTQNRRFTYEEILKMTNSLIKNIGEGGFGAVYLGYWEEGQKQVAVKMLSPSSSQGYKEFKAEAQLLMIVHHRNLVSLIGYCDEGDKLGLIYEYMANGNLQSHISDKCLDYLTWEDRLHIALDSAQGLEYLHNGCKPPIVHRDVKPANILLNDKFEAKLADFGLSRAFDVDAVKAGDAATTMVAGTPGYLDPEYYMTQQLNEKSDIYSFGIVLLEIITSRSVMGNVEERQMHISKWVSQKLSDEGDIKVITDRRLRGDYDRNSVWKAVEVAMSCVSATSNKRPSMSEVVSELSQCLSMEKSRKTEGFTSDTINSVDMVSYDVFSPEAR